MSSKWRDCATRDGIYSFSTFTGHIDKPDLDDRDYRLVDLNNGLRAIVIHDDTADKAAACVTVQVGAMHDPVSYPCVELLCNNKWTIMSHPTG